MLQLNQSAVDEVMA